jgi:hypothetical protein
VLASIISNRAVKTKSGEEVIFEYEFSCPGKEAIGIFATVLKILLYRPLRLTMIQTTAGQSFENPFL